MTANAPPGDETRLLTGEELAAMGDIGPSELVEGRLVRMGPTKPEHGNLEYRMAKAIGDIVDKQALGQVLVGEVGIYTRRHPGTIRGADVLFVSNERLSRATPGAFLDVPPELVVEILSPEERWGKVRKKLREYSEAGVRIVLVVDADESSVSAYRSLENVREYSGSDILSLEDILPGFSLPLPDLFTPPSPPTRT